MITRVARVETLYGIKLCYYHVVCSFGHVLFDASLIIFSTSVISDIWNNNYFFCPN